MAIYFVRNGADDEGYRGGWSQGELNVEGYRQSEKLGSYLKNNQSTYQIHRIVSSDLHRALDTANEIANYLKLSVESSAQWRETNNGVIAGMPNEIVNDDSRGYISRVYEWTNKNKNFAASNTGIHKVENSSGQWKLTFENSLEHL